MRTNERYEVDRRIIRPRPAGLIYIDPGIPAGLIYINPGIPAGLIYINPGIPEPSTEGLTLPRSENSTTIFST